jgi:septal ring factor EnvC (AmiA/AmiB activator)
MRRALRLAAALVVGCVPAAAAPPASPGKAEELRELRTRIERLQQDLAAAEKSRGGALEQVRDAEKAASEAHRALFALAEERRRIEAELEALAREAGDVRSAASAQQTLAEKLLRIQYEQGAADRLRLIVEGRDAATVARHLAYYGYIQRARAEAIGDLKEKAAKLGALESDARTQRRRARSTSSARFARPRCGKRLPKSTRAAARSGASSATSRGSRKSWKKSPGRSPNRRRSARRAVAWSAWPTHRSRRSPSPP